MVFTDAAISFLPVLGIIVSVSVLAGAPKIHRLDCSADGKGIGILSLLGSLTFSLFCRRTSLANTLSNRIRNFSLRYLLAMQFAAAIVSVAVPNYGDRGYASFGLLIFELNLVVWVGW